MSNNLEYIIVFLGIAVSFIGIIMELILLYGGNTKVETTLTESERKEEKGYQDAYMQHIQTCYVFGVAATIVMWFVTTGKIETLITNGFTLIAVVWFLLFLLSTFKTVYAKIKNTSISAGINYMKIARSCLARFAVLIFITWIIR